MSFFLFSFLSFFLSLFFTFAFFFFRSSSCLRSHICLPSFLPSCLPAFLPLFLLRLMWSKKGILGKVAAVAHFRHDLGQSGVSHIIVAQPLAPQWRLLVALQAGHSLQERHFQHHAVLAERGIVPKQQERAGKL